MSDNNEQKVKSAEEIWEEAKNECFSCNNQSSKVIALIAMDKWYEQQSEHTQSENAALKLKVEQLKIALNQIKYNCNPEESSHGALYFLAEQALK